MRAFGVVALAVLVGGVLTGCVSAFPAGALDVGRGATPMERGATRLQVGIGGGAAPLSLTGGGGAGGRVEHQLLDDLSLGVDLSAGAQTVAGIAWTFPAGGYLNAQYNPFGIQFLAVRLRVGGGIDSPLAFGVAVPTSSSDASGEYLYPAPYAAGVLQVVLSAPLDDAIEAYVAPGLGVKQFFGSELSAARLAIAANTAGHVDTIVFPGVTGGISAAVAPHLSFYVSANVTPAVIIGETASTALATPARPEQTVFISPSGNVQTGLAFTF